MSDKERIEKEARESCEGSPQFLFEFRGYVNGATSEHTKAWNAAIEMVIGEFKLIESLGAFPENKMPISEVIKVIESIKK